MNRHTPPLILRWAYSSCHWKVNVKEKELFLTFDDGPIPKITPYVLDMLSNFGVKATFFCVGDNVKKHPDILQNIIEDGHCLGNHTFNHLNGWKSSLRDYMENINLCTQEMLANGVETNIFRPPYGKITPTQLRALKKLFKIIMWDVLTADYDQNLSSDLCFQNSVAATSPGSIIIFHDSPKAFKNLQYTLPRYIETFLTRGFSFELL